MPWRVCFNNDPDLGLAVLGQDGILKTALDLTLQLPATDVSGVTEVELAELIVSSQSGVVCRLHKLASS